MRKILINKVVMFFVLLFFSFDVYTQAADQKALARAQHMLKKLNADKAQIQQQLLAIQKEYEDYKKATEEKLAKSKGNQKKTSQTLGKWKESHAALKELLEENIFQLREEKRRSAELLDLLAKQGENFKVCDKNNSDLVDVNTALLALFGKKSKKISITGLPHVRAENIVQDYSFEIQDLDLEVNKFLLNPIKEVSDLAAAPDESSDEQ